MVYVYAKLSELNKYIGTELTTKEIKDTLSDMGMDIKGESKEQDPELKVEITAEKMDMVSSVGIGRAIKYYRGLATELPKYELKTSGFKLKVLKSAKDVRPVTVCALIKNAPMTQELLNEIIEIQEKMHASFGRNRKKAAIGIYPLSEITFPITFGAEDPSDIIFRPLEMSEKVNGHDILKKHETGKKYAHLLDHCDMYPVFRDDEGKVLSMPPIINSHDTGRVDISHKDFFIECSGHNLVHLDNILKVLVTTLIEMGCEAESIEVEYEDQNNYILNLDSYTDVVNLDYINKLIGINIDKEEVKTLASKVMFNVKNITEDGDITFEIPAFRNDIWDDSDIADDIARAYGYNNIVPTFPSISSVGEHIPFSQFKESITENMIRLGFLETYTYMLTSTQVQFKDMGIDENKYSYIKISDSAEQGINMVRLQILPETLTTLRINRKNKYPQKIFENGLTIQPDEEVDTGAKNESHLCVAIADPKSNYTQIKGVLDTVFKLEGIDFKVEESDLDFLIEGRRANIFVKGHNVGFIGELHPQILENFSLIVPVSVLEINLEKVWELINY